MRKIHEWVEARLITSWAISTICMPWRLPLVYHLFSRMIILVPCKRQLILRRRPMTVVDFCRFTAWDRWPN
jgi:hypothetical protein